jgi:hypothetical protein
MLAGLPRTASRHASCSASRGSFSGWRSVAAGLRWTEVDLDAGTLTVSAQLQQLGGRLVSGPPKSEAGWRVIALDVTTLVALRAHRPGRTPNGWRPGPGGGRPGTCSPPLTGRRCGRTG